MGYGHARLRSCRDPACSRAPIHLRRTLCHARSRPEAQVINADGQSADIFSKPIASGTSGSSEWYQQWDMAAVHAYEARRVFIESIMHGEPQADIVKAALAVAAEDDAIATHSTVPFPVKAWRQRIQRLAADCASHALPALPPGAPSKAVADAVSSFLRARRFAVPECGRSALPAGSIVDHAGVWEEPRDAYLHELLIRRRGTPAALAVLLYAVHRQLFLDGAVDFMVRIDCQDFEGIPRAVPLQLPRAMLATAGGALNTCSTDALHECLSHLKRSFWPYAWDTGLDAQHGLPLGSFGGFPGAAKEAINGPASTYIQAVSRAAEHRLKRGIWTTPGAGDIRRAIAACERLVLLAHCSRASGSAGSGAAIGTGSRVGAGTLEALERRDLGVLYVHAGLLEEGKAELQEAVRLGLELVEEPEVAALLEQLLLLVAEVQLRPGQVPLTATSWLQQPKPDPRELEKFPLSW
eukprot:jgi/Ulvmu1/6935/UM032_0013.1